jgi:hypothetical protein
MGRVIAGAAYVPRCKSSATPSRGKRLNLVATNTRLTRLIEDPIAYAADGRTLSALEIAVAATAQWAQPVSHS